MAVRPKPALAGRQLRRRRADRQRVSCLKADGLFGPEADPGEAGSALIGGEGVALRIDGQCVAAGVDGGAAGLEGDRLGGPAVLLQPVGVQAGVGDADLVAVDAVDQTPGRAETEQVVCASRRCRASVYIVRAG